MAKIVKELQDALSNAAFYDYNLDVDFCVNDVHIGESKVNINIDGKVDCANNTGHLKYHFDQCGVVTDVEVYCAEGKSYAKYAPDSEWVETDDTAGPLNPPINADKIGSAQNTENTYSSGQIIKAAQGVYMVNFQGSQLLPDQSGSLHEAVRAVISMPSDLVIAKPNIA